MTALLASAGLSSSTMAGEVGVYPFKSSWGDGQNIIDFHQGPKGSSAVSDSRTSPKGYKSFASAGFHGLSTSCNASTEGNAPFEGPRVGGGAYWFEQITISSPSVPVGTIGTVDFTLFFTGDVAVQPRDPSYQRENWATVGYRWNIDADTANNAADLNVGESFFETIRVNGSYTEHLGGNFRNQPRHHQAIFRFGVPFDFTLSVSCRGTVFTDYKTMARASVQCSGWNGFRDARVRFGDLVTDATISSPSGFNYANAGSSTYTRWASLHDLNTSSMQVDSNGNGVPNLLEYALGRDPLSLNSQPATTRGLINIGGSNYQTLTFTRPRLAGRAADIVYLPQRSTVLGNWTSTGLETTVAPSTTDTETVTVRSTEPVGAQANEFLRLEVTGP